MHHLTSLSIWISFRLLICIGLLLYGHDRVGNSALAADVTSSNGDLAVNCSAGASRSDASIVGGFISEERRLLLCIMRGYDPAVRPAATPNDTITVALNNQLLTITDFREKDNVLITENWFRQVWQDSQLKWKPEDFGGIVEIMIPINRLWTPKMALFNNAGDALGYVMGEIALVEHNGTVTWVPHMRMKSYCDMDLSNFPYDEQNCTLIFGTWNYDKSLVDISVPAESNENFYYDPNAEWSVTDYHVFIYNYVDVQRHPERYYPSAIYSMTLKRSTGYYEFIFVHPTRVLTVLILLLFLLPHESQQRFILAGAILICLTILLLVLQSFLPSHISKQPVIGSYLAFNSIFVIIVIKVSMLTANFQYKRPGCAPVPNYLRWMLRGRFGRLLCVSKSLYVPLPSVSGEDDETRRDLELQFTPPPAPVRYQSSPQPTVSTPPRAEDDPALGPGTIRSLEAIMEDVRRYLRLLIAQQQRLLETGVTSHRQLVVEEWKQLGVAIDRMLFIIFFIITVFVLISISVRAH